MGQWVLLKKHRAMYKRAGRNLAAAAATTMPSALSMKGDLVCWKEKAGQWTLFALTGPGAELLNVDGTSQCVAQVARVEQVEQGTNSNPQ